MADLATPRQDWFRQRNILFIAIAVGALLRLAVVPLPIIYFPDEIWQYMEPARHLAGGRSVVPWEFREGLRSWLVPAMLAPAAMLGEWLATGSQLPVLLQRLLLAAASLGIIASAAALGLRISRLHGLFSALVAASWFELVYFAPRPLSESLSLAFVFPALYLLTLPAERKTRRIMAVAGAVLGLAFCIRLQLAPALFVLAAFGCGRRLRRGWLPLAAGGAAALMLAGAVDLLAGEMPFAWMARNFTVNLIEGRSEQYGTGAWHWYLRNAWYIYGFALFPGLFLALIGAKRYPAIFWSAITNLAVHSAIPHKEARFMLFSGVLLVVLAAIGTADVLQRLSRRWPGAVSPPAIAAAALLWIGVSATCAFTQPFLREWQRGREVVLAQAAAAAAPSPCGLGLLRLWSMPSGAYTFYNRDTPMYLFVGPDADRRMQVTSQAFNLLIAVEGLRVPPNYQLKRCFEAGPNARGPLPRCCLYQRPGICVDSPQARQEEINAVLRRIGH